MKRALGVLAVAVMMGAAGAWAGEEGGHTPAPASKELERLKTLAGRWEGTSQEGTKAAEPATVEYKVTSGGSAVVETLFPGTPYEMVSVYHDQGGRVAMTHYCMLGNHPELALQQSSDTELDFSLAENSSIDPATEQHMHGLALTWTGPDLLTQTWTSYKDGKPSDSVTITLSRAPKANGG